jgi:hypothetical protein
VLLADDTAELQAPWPEARRCQCSAVHSACDGLALICKGCRHVQIGREALSVLNVQASLHWPTLLLNMACCLLLA